MHESILNHKRVLIVDDEPDVLEVLTEEIHSVAPECGIDTATSYDKAIELLSSWTYDLAILDIMGVRGFDILKRATTRPNPVPVVMLTGHSLSPESLKQSVELGARAYLPKEYLGSVVPFLEDVLTYEYGTLWRRVLKQVEGVFDKSWGPYWREPDAPFWKAFEEKVGSRKK
jgi:CheY-like chemotaxis protein